MWDFGYEASSDNGLDLDATWIGNCLKAAMRFNFKLIRRKLLGASRRHKLGSCQARWRSEAGPRFICMNRQFDSFFMDFSCCIKT